MRFAHPHELLDHVGAEIGVSAWLTIDQTRIDAFRAIVGGPGLGRNRVGDSAAHGYLLLSLFPRLTTECLAIGQVRRTLNYGLDRLRFVAPVPVGARVRLRQTIASAEKTAAGGVRLTLDGALEVEHSHRPAVTGQTVRLIFPGVVDDA
ncbi:MAG: MaoC/PaaZ C-terminal domain-containing protein [Acidobacteria bacterium]|nr:MaoC/PaaZ C-terminal domain-containing protein [Acidobacteriota bacterium]